MSHTMECSSWFSKESVLDNYLVLQALWEKEQDSVTDSEIRARAIGVDTTMRKFTFLFGLVLAEKVFSKVITSVKLCKHHLLQHQTGRKSLI